MLKYGGKEQALKWFVQNSQCVRKSQHNKMTGKEITGGFKGVIFGWCDHGQFSPFLFPTYLYFFERQ